MARLCCKVLVSKIKRNSSSKWSNAEKKVLWREGKHTVYGCGRFLDGIFIAAECRFWERGWCRLNWMLFQCLVPRIKRTRRSNNVSLSLRGQINSTFDFILFHFQLRSITDRFVMSMSNTEVDTFLAEIDQSVEESRRVMRLVLTRFDCVFSRLRSRKCWTN
jgi:hypothetical protein